MKSPVNCTYSQHHTMAPKENMDCQIGLGVANEADLGGVHVFCFRDSGFKVEDLDPKAQNPIVPKPLNIQPC